MSAQVLNKWLIVIGIVTGVVTIMIQIMGIGELKGQVLTIQQTLREDVHYIKAVTNSHGNDISDLKARVASIERNKQ